MKTELPDKDERDNSKALFEQCWLGPLLLAFWALVIVAVFFGCSTKGAQRTLVWLPNTDSVTEYRLYRGIDLLTTTVQTRAIIEAESGDVISLTASNGTAESPRANVTIPHYPLVTVSSEASGYAANALIDGQPLPIYASQWQPMPDVPQWIEIDLGERKWIGGITYLPRQDAHENGHLTGYTIYGDGLPLIAGAFTEQDKAEKAIIFHPTHLRRLRVHATITHITGSELQLIERPPPIMRFSFQYGEDLAGWEDLPPIDRPKKQRGFVRWKLEELP